jgi:hypothetical protein
MSLSLMDAGGLHQWRAFFIATLAQFTTKLNTAATIWPLTDA